MIFVWGYIVVGTLLAVITLTALHIGEKTGANVHEARKVVDMLGLPAVAAAVVLFWPALAWLAYGRKR